MAVSGFGQASSVEVDKHSAVPLRSRRMKWPAAAALIIVMSTLLWVAIIQSISWAGLF